MASLISIATGNLTAAGTWGTSDATALLDSEAGNTALTTSYVVSSTFTPGAITIDGIAVKIAAVTGSTGTISVALDLVGVTVTNTEITLNVTDLPTCSTGAAANEGGWVLFKFGSNVLLTGATAYGVKAKTSSASQVNLYRDGTAGNWSRQLRTTTTAAPGAGDTMHVIGEHTGAGTGNSFVVTMDNTTGTDFGPGTDGSVAMTIGKRGTLTCGVAASTAYLIRLSGNCIVYNGGTLNTGTSGSAMPSTSSLIFYLDPVADGGMGLIIRNGGTWNGRGNPITTVATTLTANVAAAGTALTVASTSGWSSTNLFAIASTTRTASECESFSLTSVDSATQVTASAGLTYAHSGTSPTQAEVINLSRNVMVASITSTIMAYVSIKPTSVVDVQYARFNALGENATDKLGINIETTTGSCSLRFISVTNFEDGGIILVGATVNNVTLEFVSYNTNNVSSYASSLRVPATTGTAITIQNSTMILPFGGNTVWMQDVGLTISGLTIAGPRCGAGADAMTMDEASATMGSWSNLTIHSGEADGLQTTLTGLVATITNLTIWRNTRYGLNFLGGSSCNLTLVSPVLFGNTTANILISDAQVIVLKSPTINSDATFATAGGIVVGGIGGFTLTVYNGSFGTTTAHTIDIDTQSPLITPTTLIMLNNTTLASSTEVSNVTTYFGNSCVRSRKHDGSATTHKNWMPNGTIFSDQTTRHTASGYSWQLTPRYAARKLILPGPQEHDTFKVAVSANVAVTVKGYVQKDGSYNGNAPRLVILGGVLTGIASDVTASLSVGASTWEQLSAVATPTEDGVLEYYFDCDGTAGAAYVDDVTITQP